MNTQQTKREYFNAEITNTTQTNVLAKYETTLLKPLISTTQGWDLCINRFRLPLSGIPLSVKNIPFQQWEVSLGFKNNGSWTYSSAYVPQYNATISTSSHIALVNTSSGNQALDGIITSIGQFSVDNTQQLPVVVGAPLGVGTVTNTLYSSIGSTQVLIYVYSTM